jgi:hypothetical protein
MERDRGHAAERTERAQVEWTSGLNALLGAWLIFAPFALQYTEFTGSAWNAGVVGGIVLVLGASRALGAYHSSWSWLSWTNVVLGIWLMAGPFAFGNGMFRRSFGITSASASRSPYWAPGVHSRARRATTGAANRPRAARANSPRAVQLRLYAQGHTRHDRCTSRRLQRSSRADSGLARCFLTRIAAP